MQGNIDLGGAVDIHVHCGPSKFPRRVDGYELAVEAADAGMDAVVMKEHFLPTVYGVPYIDRLLERDERDIDVFGSLVMNYCNGGFNPFMVQTALDFGAKVVWVPTIDARNHGEKTNGVGKYLGMDDVAEEYRGKTGLYALTENGELKDDVALCLDKIVEHDAVLGLGHGTYEETHAMVEYLGEQGHSKVFVDHPNYYITDFDREQQQTLVDFGAYINFQFAAVSPKFHWLHAEELADNIRNLGVDNVMVSSDMGQIPNPSSPEGLRILGELLLEEGFSREEYRTMVETNPKSALGMK